MEGQYVCVSIIGRVRIKGLTDILKALEKIFLLPFRFGQNYNYPLYAFEPKRNQYDAHKIIKELLARMPSESIKLIGITDIDICTPVLEYVFGEAQLNGGVAIISYHRLRPSFYHLPDDDNLLLLRLKKVLVHEIGHCFGAFHCDNYRCVMYLANNIFTLDSKGDDFCLQCGDFIKEKIKKEYYGKA
ncbi:MAG: archaemetzincin family Zn-dependent metalloprotease [candidate division WOR-3 bacterium]